MEALRKNIPSFHFYPSPVRVAISNRRILPCFYGTDVIVNARCNLREERRDLHLFDQLTSV